MRGMMPVYMPSNQDIAEKIREVGGQYAVTGRYRHPSLSSVTVGRNMFDVEKITDMLQSTLSYIEQCGNKGQIILFVSTRKETIDLVEKTAQALSMPYMLNRWIGGALSNFKNIRGRVEYMERLRREKKEGKWTRFTKKEKVLMNRELTKLESKFLGIISLEEMPSAVFVLDTRKEHNAVTEANRLGVSVIGFSNADADRNLIQHPIIANIQSRDAVQYILSLIEEAYLTGVRKKGKNDDTTDDTE